MSQVRWIAATALLLLALVASSQAHASVKTTNARIAALEQRLDRQDEWINSLTEQLMVYDECFDQAVKYRGLFLLFVQPNCIVPDHGHFRLTTSLPR